MQHPETIPEKIQEKLKSVGMWDVNPLNLFRITWKNQPKVEGALFQAVPNYVEIPSVLSGVPCRIIAMAGKWFPTGCHKVGASFGCLAPRLVTGQFDVDIAPGRLALHRQLLPRRRVQLHACSACAGRRHSPGRDEPRSALTGCTPSVRQVIATPGCESNVKEIFDKTSELKHDPHVR